MISERWLREFVALPDLAPEEFAEVFSNLGLEVEGVQRVAADFSGVIVSRVESIRVHPAAERLRLATVDTGGGLQEVVCGAWNFEAGALVPLATVGSRLAGGLEVGEREIRGVLSRGMICSEAELGIGEDASGILVLEEGFAPPGSDFAAALPYPDVLYDLAITPNRSDAMSIYGVARDLAAFFDVPIAPLEAGVTPTGPPTRARVRIEAPDLCPRFTAREISGITIGPSPLWMRLRLRDAGMRPINNVVDVTNYVMLEYGQPLHAFDLDLIPEETLVIRRARPGERLTTLDSLERTLGTDDLVVAGPADALAIAGIMGGETSEVSPDTGRVLLEVAHFSAPDLLLSGKRHGMRTEAVARFERGVDPALPPIASARAAALMADLAGGTVHEGFVDEYPRPIEPWRVELPAGEATRLLGVDLDGPTVAGYLRRLGFGVEQGDPLVVTVPTYRPDVTRPADLVEEVARLHGFDAIPDRLPLGTGLGLPVAEQRRRLVRRAMVGAGYLEIMTYSFVGRDDVAALDLPDDDRRSRPIAVRNPLNEEEGVLRTSLIPAMLRAVRVNQTRHNESVAVFEIGRVFLEGGGPIPDQPYALGFAAAGPIPGPAFAGRRPSRDATDAVGLWETLSGALRIEGRIEQGTVPGFHPGRAAWVVVDGRRVGAVGELHPSVAGRYEVTGRVAAGEIDLEALLGAPPAWRFRAPSPYPPVVFDLAFDLPGSAPAGALVACIEDAAGPFLERTEIFDVFTGPPLDAGRKSIAVRLSFRAPDRTLTDDDLAPVRAAVATRVERDLGGKLRGG
jgi:phenylalanyl-tRNA synthetase beta chain